MGKEIVLAIHGKLTAKCIYAQSRRSVYQGEFDLR